MLPNVTIESNVQCHQLLAWGRYLKLITGDIWQAVALGMVFNRDIWHHMLSGQVSNKMPLLHHRNHKKCMLIHHLLTHFCLLVVIVHESNFIKYSDQLMQSNEGRLRGCRPQQLALFGVFSEKFSIGTIKDDVGRRVPIIDANHRVISNIEGTTLL